MPQHRYDLFETPSATSALVEEHTIITDMPPQETTHHNLSSVTEPRAVAGHRYSPRRARPVDVPADEGDEMWWRRNNQNVSGLRDVPLSMLRAEVVDTAVSGAADLGHRDPYHSRIHVPIHSQPRPQDVTALGGGGASHSTMGDRKPRWFESDIHSGGQPRPLSPMKHRAAPSYHTMPSSSHVNAGDSSTLGLLASVQMQVGMLMDQQQKAVSSSLSEFQADLQRSIIGVERRVSSMEAITKRLEDTVAQELKNAQTERQQLTDKVAMLGQEREMLVRKSATASPSAADAAASGSPSMLLRRLMKSVNEAPRPNAKVPAPQPKKAIATSPTTSVVAPPVPPRAGPSGLNTSPPRATSPAAAARDAIKKATAKSNLPAPTPKHSTVLPSPLVPTTTAMATTSAAPPAGTPTSAMLAKLNANVESVRAEVHGTPGTSAAPSLPKPNPTPTPTVTTTQPATASSVTAAQPLNHAAPQPPPPLAVAPASHTPSPVVAEAELPHTTENVAPSSLNETTVLSAADAKKMAAEAQTAATTTTGPPKQGVYAALSKPPPVAATTEAVNPPPAVLNTLTPSAVASVAASTITTAPTVNPAAPVADQPISYWSSQKQ